MPDLGAITWDSIGLGVGVVLTLMILSYLLGDNYLYRLALHLFIGLLVGYSFGVVLREVFLLKVVAQLAGRTYWIVAPIILGLLLLVKGLPRHTHIGNISVAYLIGVGAAVALGGALLGAIIPQVSATGRALSLNPPSFSRLLDGLVIVSGTICTLMAFNWMARRGSGWEGRWTRFVGALAWVGRWFLIVAFGVALAGALTASLSIFIGRVQYLIDAVLVLL